MNETQSASSSIWTRVADSISYNDNRYAKHAKSKCMSQTFDPLPQFGST